MFSDGTENAAQGSHHDRIMHGHGQGKGPVQLCLESDVRTALAFDLVSEAPSQRAHEPVTGYVAGKLHNASTSSRTK